jgi:hypothetical protein
MAYQQCANLVISLLKDKYPNHDWNEDKLTILQTLLSQFACKVLCFDDEILQKVYDEVKKGLTITNYIVPLMDIDIDPSLRQLHEYDKDYDECLIEEENNNFKFNLN